jgi:hypothetical protein
MFWILTGGGAWKEGEPGLAPAYREVAGGAGSKFIPFGNELEKIYRLCLWISKPRIRIINSESKRTSNRKTWRDVALD